MGGSKQQKKKSQNKKVTKQSQQKKSNKKSHAKSTSKNKSHEKKLSKVQNPKQALNSKPTVATPAQMNPNTPNPPAPLPPAPYYPAPNAPQYGAPYPPATPYAPVYSAPPMVAPVSAPAPVPVAPVIFAPPPPRNLVDPHCPPGLEYLTQIDQLVVIQEVDMLQVFTKYESKNRYSVKNKANQNVYYCVETSDVLTMNLMHSDRPFEIIVMDNFGVPVLRVTRPYHFGNVLCGCPDLLQVSSGNGQLIGTVQEQFKCCGSLFTVHDTTGNVVLFLEGPPCRFDYIDTEFEVLTGDQAKVGAVTRQFPGFFKELYTHANIFGVCFPIDLQVEVKALLLASTFLIDFMFYQQKDNEQNDAFGGGGGSSSDNDRSRSPRRSASRNSPDMNMGVSMDRDIDMNMGL